MHPPRFVERRQRSDGVELIFDLGERRASVRVGALRSSRFELSFPHVVSEEGEATGDPALDEAVLRAAETAAAFLEASRSWATWRDDAR